MNREYCRYCNAEFISGGACRSENAVKTCAEFASLMAENAKLQSPAYGANITVRAVDADALARRFEIEQYATGMAFSYAETVAAARALRAYALSLSSHQSAPIENTGE